MYKLYYFDIKGLGEAIRLLLTYKGIPFEDVRVTFPEWAELKMTMPTGQVPVLEKDGKMLAQSVAILKYLSDQHDLTPSDPWEAAKTMEIVMNAPDSLTKVYYLLATPDADKPAAFTKAVEEFAKPSTARLEAALGNPSGFFFDKISMVDFAVYSQTLAAAHFFTINIDEYPKLAAHKAKIEGLPELQDHFAKYKDIIYSPLDPANNFAGLAALMAQLGKA